MQNDWIPVFKTGTHTDSKGNTRTWTEADIDKIASSYDTGTHEAPVVIGHPVDNAPAYGWVEGLKREGQILYAKFKGLVPEFVQMVKKGLFKKRSISLNQDLTLNHIGWLGAMPPAVKGLPDVAFSDKGSLTIEYEEREEDKTMSFIEKLKNLLKAEGVDVADINTKNFSEEEAKRKVETFIQQQTVEFSEKVASFEAAKKKHDEELKAKEDAVKAREDALKNEEAAAKKKAVASFCEGLKKESRLIPAMEKLGMGITNFMEAIASIETTIEFSEGDKKVKQTPLEFMQLFLSSLPKQIEFGEVAGRNKDAGSGSAGEKLEALTQKKLKEHKNLQYSGAFAAAQAENPELAAEYAQELNG